MAIVYKLVNSDDPNKEIPSKAYVDHMIKQMCDALIYHNNSSGSHDSLNKMTSCDIDTKSYTTKQLPSAEPINTQPINAEDIKTDANNAFISQTTLMSLKERPTLLETKQLINSAKEDITKTMHSRFDALLNAPDAMEKVKVLIGILKEDKTLSALMQSIADRTNNAEFIGHVSSELHLSNNDRKALNVLIKLCNMGFADWEADENSVNYIKNKPESLPANGGNADTVGNYSVKKLINKSPVDLIIGDSNGSYDKDVVDHCLAIDYSNLKNIIDLIQNNSGGKIVLRKGIYYFKQLRICDGRKENDYDIILVGEGCNTIISNTEVTINNNVKIRDIEFETSNVHIGSRCEIDKCNFKLCTIFLEASMSTSIMNSNFKDCTFIYVAKCSYNFIIYNRFENTTGVQYYGLNNVIHNNITI